jgi:energy-coupling factor transport system ATP-binding protein
MDFSVSKGEFVCIAGKSGGGKSTILRTINGLIPYFYSGEIQGEIKIKDKNWIDLSLYEKSKIAGSVFQEPMEQFFLAQVFEEVAIAPSNFEFPIDKIQKAVNSSLLKMGLEKLSRRFTHTLSSGEAQKVAIASVLTLEPDIIVLDEPSSNLSEEAMTALYDSLKELKNSGKTIIVAEHRFSYLADIPDRLIIINSGSIEYDGDPDKLNSEDFCNDFGLRYEKKLFDKKKPPCEKKNEMNINIKDLSFRYKKNLPCIWEGLNRSFFKNEITIITGKNGSGKTSFLKTLMGLLKPTKGHIYYESHNKTKKYMVMQNPDFQFFFTSVNDEINYNNHQNSDYWLERMGLSHLKCFHPLSLSGGEKQRLLLACAFSSGADVLLFDEPTSGMDGIYINLLKDAVSEEKEKNKTVLIATHDNLLMNYLDCEIMKF